MPSNVEVKARVRNLSDLLARIEAVVTTAPRVIEQRDTFFVCPNGRVKLREFGTNEEHAGAVAELIWYARDDVTGSKLSQFKRASVDTDAVQLRDVLSTAYGVVGSVVKRRLLYMHESTHTRVHVDQVEGLGTFIELEVQVQPGQSLEDAHAIAARLTNDFGIEPADHIAGAYMDMLLAPSQ